MNNDETLTLYATPPILIGRHEWRVQVTLLDGELQCIPVWRRVGFEDWQYPTSFAGPVPAGVLSYALLPPIVLSLSATITEHYENEARKRKS